MSKSNTERMIEYIEALDAREKRALRRAKINKCINTKKKVIMLIAITLSLIVLYIKYGGQ